MARALEQRARDQLVSRAEAAAALWSAGDDD